MNAAGQEPAAAALFEVAASKSAATGHKRDGKAPYGIKAKLFLAFSGIWPC
jgi:hypothetical protein